MTPSNSRRSVAIFDLGGVLLQWNPRHLYRKLFNGDDAAMEDFLANVCTTEWNERQDAGRTFAEGTRELLPRHADKVELIEAWGKRFGEMIPGPIDGTVDVLSDLRARNVPLYGVSNWSAETFPPQRARFPFLSWLKDIVVSGEVGVSSSPTRASSKSFSIATVSRRIRGIHRRRRRQCGRGVASRHPRHPLPLARSAKTRSRRCWIVHGAPVMVGLGLDGPRRAWLPAPPEWRNVLRRR